MDNRRRENIQFRCNLCDAQFKSAREKATHKTSALHAFMLGLKRAQQSYMGDATTLNDQIVETGKREPLIGLEYIYEYAEDGEGKRMYECTLCESAFTSDLIFFHIVGIQHRISYLVKLHPIMGITADFTVQQQVHYRKLLNNALAIEQIHGRKKVNVVNEVYVSKPDVPEISETDTDHEGEPDKGNQRKPQEETRSQSRGDDDGYTRSRQHDRGLESRSQSGDMPRFPHLNPNENLDGKPLRHASNLGSEPNSRDDASKFGPEGGTKIFPDAKAGSLPAQPGNYDVTPFQPATSGGPPPQDASQDTSFRSRSVDRGGPSALPDRGGNRAGDARYQNEDFDARALQRASNQGSEPNNRDNATKFGPGGGTKMLPDAKVGSLPTKPGNYSATPFQPATSGGPPPQDSSKDTSFRRRNVDRGGPSSLPDRGGNRDPKDNRSDPKDQNRRRNRSPESHSRLQRTESRDGGSGGDIDVRSVLPSGGISFRELRAAHERKSRGGVGRANLPMEKKEKDTDSDMEVCSMEFSDCEMDDFWCKEELFDFLKSYHIGDDEGVKFILEAIKLMSDALVRHKSRKETLQKRILEEKQRLEEEKQEFLVIKKRKENKISSTTLKGAGPENAKLFKEVTGMNKAEKVQQPQQVSSQSGAAAGVQQAAPQHQAENVNQLTSLTNFHKALVSGIAQAVQQSVLRPQAANVNQQSPLTNFQKALMSNRTQVVQPAVPRAQAPGNVNRPQQVIGSQRPLAPGAAPALQRPQGSEMRFNQNRQTSGSGFDPSNQQAPFPGQGGVRYSAPTNVNQPQRLAAQRPQDSGSRFNQNPSSRFDTRGPVDGAGTGMGADSASRFNQNPSSRFDTRGGPVDGTGMGADSGSRFNQNQSSRFDTRGPVDGTGMGAGSEMHFNQNPQPRVSRFDDPNPRRGTGQGAVSYPGSQSRFNQNPQYSGSWSDNRGSLEKMQPRMAADRDADYNQMQWNSGAQSGDQDYYDEHEPTTGAGAGRYGDGRYGDRDAEYNQMQWNSGAQSGDQDYYDEPEQTTGEGDGRYGDGKYGDGRYGDGKYGDGRYGEQYNENQWESQYNTRGSYGSEMNTRYGSQGPQATATTGYSSNQQQGMWPSQSSSKPGVYPTSILKNRTANRP